MEDSTRLLTPLATAAAHPQRQRSKTVQRHPVRKGSHIRHIRYGASAIGGTARGRSCPRRLARGASIWIWNWDARPSGCETQSWKASSPKCPSRRTRRSHAGRDLYETPRFASRYMLGATRRRIGNRTRRMLRESHDPRYLPRHDRLRYFRGLYFGHGSTDNVSRKSAF
jgi:hypothetical protein